MKTVKLSSIVLSLLVVIFLSFSGSANSTTRLDGDILRSTTDKNVTETTKNPAELSTTNVENEYSYLRFDVNNFTGNEVAEEVTDNSLDYLRFDVSHFENANTDLVTEMPASNSLDYLRFDVSHFENANTGEVTEMPVPSSLDYLRFDVNKYVSLNSGSTNEMPLNK